MVRFTPLQFIPVLIAAASHAGEITIESRAFRIESTFSATALPNSEGMLLRFSPKIWKDYEIVEISDHGSKVSKGDLLVSFDTEEIDKKLEDAQLALESSALSLAQAALDLKNLIATSPHRLEAIRRSAEIAEEEHTYFTQVRRKADEETAAQSLKRYEQILSNQREELKQLSKMYEADDITENTEEIILVRAPHGSTGAQARARC